MNAEKEKMGTLFVRWEVDYRERIGSSPKSGVGLGGAILIHAGYGFCNGLRFFFFSPLTELSILG